MPYPLLLLALLVAACAGTDGTRGVYRGKSLSIAPVDTAEVRVDSSALDDVLEVFPDDGGPLSGPRIFPLHFEPRFRRQVERRLERAGLRLLAAAAAVDSTVAAAPADPRVATDHAAHAASIPAPDSFAASLADSAADYALALRGLRVHRGDTEMLLPKVGNLKVRPLYMTGDWELRESASGHVVEAGRMQMVVTTNRRATSDEWRKAFDEAARQVMVETPFRR